MTRKCFQIKYANDDDADADADGGADAGRACRSLVSANCKCNWPRGTVDSWLDGQRITVTGNREGDGDDDTLRAT